ncbi:50S ribosomal protein L6 [Patescibacteria group bacterium]|nr:50S ribosomal protein L6 [Patescibacteria group bacterium]MBU1890346.1 50S ribosomal protein L6 [Patescibacteria group bacterium]
MSKIGKTPITIPSGVDVKAENGLITVKGPKGELSQSYDPNVIIKLEDNQAFVTVKDKDNRIHRAFWGLTRSLLNNMIIGVSQGHEKKMEINGVGYRAEMKGKVLNLKLGYSHPIDYQIPDQIEVKVEKNIISIAGIDKQVVGETAASIRKFRPPEPYKGKGIKYVDEVIRRKAGKVAKSAEGDSK